MTAPLRDVLDDLAGDLARDPGVDARQVWASGRHRRRARRLQGVAAGLAVVLLALLLVPLGAVRAPTEWAGPRPAPEGVTDFPARIARQWWVRALPDRPGPLALLVQARPGFPQRWYGVAPDGTRWRLPEVAHRTDQYPTLSPGGRLLGYLETEDGPYVLHDLVTGDRRRIDDVADNRELARATHRLQGQVPTHWAPDGSRAVLPALEPVLLDVASGLLRPVARPEGRAVLAGFSGPEQLVWLREVPRAAEPGDSVLLNGALEAVTTDLSGAEPSMVRLPGFADPASILSQWSGAVSPDGSEVAVVSGPGGGSGQVNRFALASGAQVTSTVPVPAGAACGMAWGERLVVPGLEVLAVAVDGDRSETVVVAEDRDDARCAVWASGALAAGGGRALFGTSTAWITWWWPEVAAGLVLLGLLLAVRERRVRDRPPAPRRGRSRTPSTSADWYA